MAQLTKDQLRTQNTTLFPDNTNREITPADVRSFNDDSIDSYALETDLNTNTTNLLPLQSNLFNNVVDKMAKGLPVTIVCLGDSVTFGFIVGGQTATPYPTELQRLLREYYDNTNITVINAGVNSETSTEILARLQSAVIDINADAVIYLAGGNDITIAAELVATTISFSGSTINDSGNGFVTAGFESGNPKKGDQITISGSTSNDGTYTIVSVTAGTITISETLTTESAGDLVTVEQIEGSMLKFAQNTTSLVGQCRTAGIEPILANYNPSYNQTVGITEEFGRRLAVYHETQQELAKFYGLKFADAYSIYKNLYSSGFQDGSVSDLNADYVHPADGDYIYLAQAIFTQIIPTVTNKTIAIETRDFRSIPFWRNDQIQIIEGTVGTIGGTINPFGKSYIIDSTTGTTIKIKFYNTQKGLDFVLVNPKTPTGGVLTVKHIFNGSTTDIDIDFAEVADQEWLTETLLLANLGFGFHEFVFDSTNISSGNAYLSSIQVRPNNEQQILDANDSYIHVGSDSPVVTDALSQNSKNSFITYNHGINNTARGYMLRSLPKFVEGSKGVLVLEFEADITNLGGGFTWCGNTFGNLAISSQKYNPGYYLGFSGLSALLYRFDASNGIGSALDTGAHGLTFPTTNTKVRIEHNFTTGNIQIFINPAISSPTPVINYTDIANGRLHRSGWFGIYSTADTFSTRLRI